MIENAASGLAAPVIKCNTESLVEIDTKVNADCLPVTNKLSEAPTLADEDNKLDVDEDKATEIDNNGTPFEDKHDALETEYSEDEEADAPLSMDKVTDYLTTDPVVTEGATGCDE